jgi:hypothetical protein
MPMESRRVVITLTATTLVATDSRRPGTRMVVLQSIQMRDPSPMLAKDHSSTQKLRVSY